MNPQLLQQIGADITALAARADEEIDASRAEALSIAPFGAGHAWTVLLTHLNELPASLDHAHAQMVAVAEVVQATAQLAALLDEAVARVEPFVASVPSARNTMAFLRGLGSALDLACAAQITAICHPGTSLPVPRITDYPEHSLNALHDVHHPFADEHLRELTDSNPDMVLLELPDSGFVAAVGTDPAAEEPVDLAEVSTVTTYVPGVGSSDPDSWQGHLDRTRTLAHTTGGPGSAGIVWLGYRAPDNVIDGLRRRAGRDAGADLAEFSSELARRHPEQRRVVLGFSYGAVVASEAARAGLHADDLVLLGSPGAVVDHVDDYTLYGDNPAVHAMTSPGDPIGLVTGIDGGVHGVDPTSPLFGAQVHHPGVRGDHGSYFREEGFYQALRNAVGS